MQYKRQDTDAFIIRYYDGSLTDKAAFPCAGRVSIEFNIKSDFLTQNAFFYLGNDERVLISELLNKEKEKNGYDVFSAVVDLAAIAGKERSGLFFYHFEAETNRGRIYTATDGVSCDLADHFCNEWQLTVFDEHYDKPSWLDGGVIYQIFPDRFAKGSQTFFKEGAVYNSDWDNGIPEYPEKPGDAFPNNTHFGGNLFSAAGKLDYLKELGVTCVYLNPVFEAFSNHKYDTGDFLKVDQSFGGDEGLDYFIKEASTRGIAVILDGVFNHVGSDSLYFNKYGRYMSEGAYQSRNSPFYDWFSFSDYPDEYECWWGVRNLPKIKPNALYMDFIYNKVIPKYMKMGVSGWRLDVVDELTSEFCEKITQAVKKYKSDALIIGEVWEDASNKIAYGERKRYFLGRQLDSVTNYPIRNAIIDFLLEGNAGILKLTLQTLYEHYPDHKFKHIMNIVGSHDTERIINVLSGVKTDGLTNKELSDLRLPEDDYKKAVERVKNAYLILAFLPGIPCIFYGDEAGMEGWRDPFNRKPFNWDNINYELHNYVKKVNQIRRSEPLFSSADIKIYQTPEEVLVIEKTSEKESLLLCANMDINGKNTKLWELNVDILKNVIYNYGNDIPAGTVKIFKKVENKWKSLI